jgi:hypothetical protein
MRRIDERDVPPHRRSPQLCRGSNFDRPNDASLTAFYLEEVTYLQPRIAILGVWVSIRTIPTLKGLRMRGVGLCKPFRLGRFLSSRLTRGMIPVLKIRKPFGLKGRGAGV